MSNLNLRHPEDGQLLRYLDGELPRGKANQIRSHLEACWQCRAEIEELQSAVGDCVRYRKNVLGACLPPPPAPWRALDFEKADAELANRSIFARLASFLSPTRNAPLRWALTGVAVLALAAGIFQQLRQTPKVEAAVLLQKAIAVAQSRPVGGRRLQITTRTGRITRSLSERAIGAASRTAASTAQETELAHLFQSAHYDWNNPLSAAAYSGWRDQLPSKKDEVLSAPNSYDIITTTADSELVSATLKLRTTDLEPLQGRFEFRNREWVEMTELVDQQTTPASTVAGATGGMPRQPGVPPGPSLDPAAAAPESSSFSEELQVAAALHQIGADLGEPIEITREAGQIVVSASGIPAQRQQQIHGQLDRLPHVVVRFADPVFPASAPVQSEPVARDAAGTEKTNRTARIEQRLGGRPQFERVSGQILDWTDSAMTRAYALRRLAEEFSADAEQTMTADDRRNLRALGRSHLDAFSKDSQSISTTLRPVLTGLGGGAFPLEVRTEANTWQAASDELLTAARRVETLTAVVLGVSPGVTAAAGTYDAAPSQLLTALSQLSRSVEQCRKLLSEPN
jgi:hypothetical protein